MAKRARGWCFTHNNYTEEEYDKWKTIECVYLVIGREVGEQGTPHLQGYVYFENAKTLSACKALIADGVHWENTKGTPKEASDYCKKDGDVFEKGTLPKSGKRNDIAAIRALVREGKTMNEIIDECPGYQAMKCAELMRKYLPPPAREAPEVLWYWGPTGTGKTRTAIEENPGAWISGRDLKWWNGYDGQKTVIIDDYRCDFCTFHELLRVLDRYPYAVEIKGGSVWLAATRIIITAPKRPEVMWASRVNEDLQQLARRITSVREFASATYT